MCAWQKAGAWNSATGGGTTFTGGTVTTPILLPDGSASAPSLAFANFPGVGFYADNIYYLRCTKSFVSLGHLIATLTLRIGDVILDSDAANVLALRNATAAQTFRAYTTFTDASNYERFSISTASSAVYLSAESAGTAAGSGSPNIDIKIIPKGSGEVSFGTYAASATIVGAGYITIKDSGGTLRKLVVAT